MAERIKHQINGCSGLAVDGRSARRRCDRGRLLAYDLVAVDHQT